MAASLVDWAVLSVLCALCFACLTWPGRGGGVAKEPGSSCQQSVAAHTKELTTP